MPLEPGVRKGGYRALMLAAGLIFVSVTWLVAGAGTVAAAAADRDCGDFPNQAAAQSYFDAHGGESV